MGRHIIKAISYRILSVIVTTLLLSAAMSLKGALTLGGVDAVIKFCLYVAHEHVWACKWATVIMRLRRLI